jgi:hypothetical protein
VRFSRLIVVLFLVLIPFALFGHALLPGRVLAPVDLLMTAYPWRALAPNVETANPLLTDVTYLVHPLLLWGAREIREGRLPLWNPQLFAGAPYLANPHTAMFFPLTWLMWLLPPAPALTLLAIGKIALVGVATYWCGRRLALGRAAAVVGAVAFMLSGQVVAWLQWPYTTTMAFLPILVGVVELMRVRADARSVAALAVAVALALFAGYPQGAAWAMLVAGVWALAVAPSAVGGARSFLTRFAAGVALGAATAAVQIVPFAEYARESAVVAYREQWMPYLSLPGRAAITWLVPFFFGGPRDFHGDWTFNAVTLTVGVVPLITLPIALALAWQRTATRVLTALAIATAAIVYGLPWVGAALASLPVVGWGQSLRVAPVLSFAVAMLGAIGVEAMTSADPRCRRRAAVAGAGAVAALAGIVVAAIAAQPEALLRSDSRWGFVLHVVGFLVAMTVTALVILRALRRPEERWRWTVVLVALEVATLAPIATRINVAAEAAWLYPEPPVMGALRAAASPGHGRILLGRHNLAMLYGLSDPTGHDGMTPAHLEAIAGPLGSGRTIGTIGSEPLGAGAVFSSAALDALGVRWFVVPPDAGPPRPDAELRYAGPDARVYENARALPRVVLVSAARCVASEESRALIRAGIAWRQEVVLTGSCEGAPPGTRDISAGWASIRDYTAHRVSIDVSASTPAYLVLFDAWFPGWVARVDGVDARLFRADHAFRAVWVPEGRHAVDFHYRPMSVVVGGLITALGLVIIGVLVVGHRWRRLGLAGAMLVIVVGAREAAALESMPLELSVPSHAAHLDTVPIAIRARTKASASTTAADLYLVWAFRPDARFVTAEGAWTSEPVPIRRGVRLEGLPAVTVDWRAEPPGSISLALLAVKAGGHPIDRANWLWSPELSWVTVKAPRTLDRSARQLLVGLGVAAFVSVAVVFVDLRRR